MDYNGHRVRGYDERVSKINSRVRGLVLVVLASSVIAAGCSSAPKKEKQENKKQKQFYPMLKKL